MGWLINLANIITVYCPHYTVEMYSKAQSQSSVIILIAKSWICFRALLKMFDEKMQPLQFHEYFLIEFVHKVLLYDGIQKLAIEAKTFDLTLDNL